MIDGEMCEDKLSDEIRVHFLSPLHGNASYQFSITESYVKIYFGR
jgi:hypothetical protein